MTAGEEITKASKSNLAFAFVTLSAEKKRDISTFYAFCRIVDDIADDLEGSSAERRRELEIWRAALAGEQPREHLLAKEFRAVIKKYHIDPKLPGEIITGMEMDLDGVRYETMGDLQLYCYRVAGAVGLVSIEIFGYRNASAREHAKALGEALQLTNILRDVGEDYRNGRRIYLPLAEMQRFGYPEQDLAAEKHNPALLGLLSRLSDQAEARYAEARRCLAPEDRKSLLPGVVMGDIYGTLLRKMQRDQFQIFRQRYRLGRAHKIALLISRTLRTLFF